MSNIVTIGYTTEGTTDKRFLESIIKKTFDQIADECESQIDVYEPAYFDFINKNGFVSDIEKLAETSFSTGISVLCIHTDADDFTDEHVIKHKFLPAFENLQSKKNEKVCKNLVAIIPITMSEAWMLADKKLLKDEIGTKLTDTKLGINHPPENIKNPKEVICEALRIAQQDLPKRRKKLEIADIYQPIGQNIKIEELEKLDSYKKFKNAVRQSFIKLNYLRE